MKTFVVSLLVALAGVCAGAEVAPFRVAIVPERSAAGVAGISWGHDSERVFHVVLTNTSDEPQRVFEPWNSWGYRALSLELALPGGARSVASVKPQRFTRNFPSTFAVPAGGHFVFPVVLNDGWQGRPAFGERGRTTVELTAVYAVQATDASAEKGVWTGRVASEAVTVEVNHW